MAFHQIGNANFVPAMITRYNRTSHALHTPLTLTGPCRRSSGPNCSSSSPLHYAPPPHPDGLL